MAPVAQKRLLLYFMIQPDTQDGSALKRCSDTLQVRPRSSGAYRAFLWITSQI